MMGDYMHGNNTWEAQDHAPEGTLCLKSNTTFVLAEQSLDENYFGVASDNATKHCDCIQDVVSTLEEFTKVDQCFTFIFLGIPVLLSVACGGILVKLHSGIVAKSLPVVNVVVGAVFAVGSLFYKVGSDDINAQQHSTAFLFNLAAPAIVMAYVYEKVKPFFNKVSHEPEATPLNTITT